MDTSSPAVFVNAELLKMYVGRRVRAVVQVMRNEGGIIVGQSTDGNQLTVKGSQGCPLSHYVEVIGIADGNQSIRAEICTDFGEKFDTVAYNALCQLANVAGIQSDRGQYREDDAFPPILSPLFTLAYFY